MKPGRAELVVLVLSLALRLFLVLHATWHPVSDTRDYHAFARSLVRGEGYRQVYDGETTAYQGFIFRAYRMPGYPAFLAATYRLFGWDPLYAYLANVAADLVTQILVVLLGRRLFGRRVALVAQALVGTHVLWTPSLMTESLFTALFAALTLAIVSGAHLRTLPRAVAVGGLLAAAVFVRPIAAVVLPVALARAFRLRSPARAAALGLGLVLPVACGVGAWAARNHGVLGEVVPLSTNLGAHQARDFGVDRDGIVLALRRQGMNEAQIDRALRREVARAALGAPLAALRIYASRVIGLLWPKPAWEVRGLLWRRTFEGPGGSRWVAALFRALYVQYYVVYPLALLGAFWLAREGRRLDGLWSLAGSYVALHALTSEGNIRFAAPLYPLFALLAAHAVVRLVARRHAAPAPPR